MIYCISNQKGGVGKSTTAQCLAAGLVRRGRKVLMIDLDAQGNTSGTLQADKTKPTAFDLLTFNAPLQSCIQCTPMDGLFLIAGSQELQKIEQMLVDTGREYRLKEILKNVRFDDVVIDTPPAVSVLTSNALTAANTVVVPTQATDYSIDAVKYMYKTVAAIQQYTNKTLTIAGILLTRHAGKSRISRDAAEALRVVAEKMRTRVFAAVIPESCKVQNAQNKKKDLFSFAPKDKAAIAYNAFIDELLSLNKKGNKK